MNGMPLEATQELGGWKTPGVLGSVYNKVRSVEVVPEMRSAINKACTLLDVRAFVVDLYDGSCGDSEGAVGYDRGAAIRVWSRRFCALQEYLKPSVALPSLADFLGILGIRVRRLELSDTPKRVVLSRGSDFRAAPKVYRNAYPGVKPSIPG